MSMEGSFGVRALAVVPLYAILLSAFVGCAHSLSLRLDRLNATVGSESVQYYLGRSNAAPTLERVVSHVAGTGRYPAMRDVGDGAEASQLG